MFKNLLILALATLSFGTFANSGKAIVNHFQAFSAAPGNNQMNSVIYVTNTATEKVSVTITLYNHDGTIIGEQDNNPAAGLIKVTGGQNYTDSSTYTSRFELSANSTARLLSDVPYNADMFGYAVVEWEKAENSTTVLQNALVSHAVIYRSYGNNVGYYSVQVNNGAPF